MDPRKRKQQTEEEENKESYSNLGITLDMVRHVRAKYFYSRTRMITVFFTKG